MPLKNLELITSKSNQIMEPIFLAIFGFLFIVLAIAIFCLFPKAKRKSQNYKRIQLEKYREQSNKPLAKYENTNMYLPSWERMKVFAPLFFGLVFTIIGISFLAMWLF